MSTNERPDTIDLIELAVALRRSWRQIAAGVCLGLLGAAAVLLLVQRQFDGTATVVLKSAEQGGGSLASRMGVPTDLLPASLTGNIQSPFETEAAILSSRAVVGRVVDSLGLQARIVSPAGTPPGAILAPATYPGSFKRRAYRFAREGPSGTFRVRGPDVEATAAAGRPVVLPVGTLTLRAEGLPASFTVQVSDREEAISSVEKRLKTGKAGGEVARLTFRADDSLTAAAVPNAVIALYLERRRTTDRGANQRRLEFLEAFTDTVSRRLDEADRRLRRFEEASGVLDPELIGKMQVERATTVRQQLEQGEVEETALNQMIAAVQAGSLTARQLAAFPTFLKSPAINDLLSQMATLETERLKLVERRTERDPEVQALEQSIKNLEDQLQPLATAYTNALARQHQTLALQLDTIQRALEALPGQTESSVELQREVKSLSATYLALQAQVVDARLAAISEGGGVRQLDVAQPPRKAAFPPPLATVLVGLVAGLLLGLGAALKAAYLGRWIRRPEDVERAVGIQGLVLDSGAPLLLGGLAGFRTIIVVPLGPGANPGAVAQQLAMTAAERETTVAVADQVTGDVALVGSLRPAIRELEEHHAVVIAPVPAFGDRRTAALLDETRPVLFVARSGRLARRELVAAVETLRRLGVPCCGLVLHGAGADGDAGR